MGTESDLLISSGHFPFYFEVSLLIFVESAIMLIPAITEAILALAAGSVAGVSKAIEFGLAKLITLVIGLFARLIGLGGLAKKVTKIFKKIRKRIGRAINKLMQKAKRAGRKIMRKLGIGKNGKKKKKESEQDIKESGNIAPETFAMAGANHTLSFKNGKVFMASKKGELTKKLNAAKKIAEKADDSAYDGKKAQVIGSITSLSSAVSGTSTKLAAAAKAKNDKKIKKTQKSFRALAENIGKFGTKYGFTDLALAASDHNESSPTGIFNKNKGNVHKSAISTANKAVISIEADEAKKPAAKRVREWSGLKTKIKETPPTEGIHNKPITNSTAYGKHAKGQVEASANRVLKDQTADEKKSAIQSKTADIEKNKSSLAYVALRDQILDKSKESTVNDRLDAVFKGEESEHSDYKITASDLSFDGTTNGKLVVKYSYTIEQLNQKPEKREFTVTMEPIGDTINHQVHGTNLGIKDPGRGKTNSAKISDSQDSLKEAKKSNKGQVSAVTSSPDTADSDSQREGIKESEYYKKQINLDTINFNASHLIADWFNGSGYASALNLVQTSEYYNKEVMGKMEKSIVTELKNEQEDLVELKPLGQYITFNAKVSSKWQEITDNRVADLIKKETKLAIKAGSEDQKKSILTKLVQDLSKERNPKFCKEVQYLINGVVLKDSEGKIIENSNYKFDKSIGEDTHLKDVLK